MIIHDISNQLSRVRDLKLEFLKSDFNLPMTMSHYYRNQHYKVPISNSGFNIHFRVIHFIFDIIILQRQKYF